MLHQPSIGEKALKPVWQNCNCYSKISFSPALMAGFFCVFNRSFTVKFVGKSMHHAKNTFTGFTIIYSVASQ
jgi:hypothetical protein